MSKPDDIRFDRLEFQDVRDYWEHEASDFTPWLAEQIRQEGASPLEDTIGLDLEVIEIERRVGRYSVDILAEVIDDGRRVVIENQLSPSDHTHLGQCIAYAAGIDADIIVWISPRFHAEHRDAVEWLNRNSREGINLFGVQIEVVTIGDSAPAPRFDPIEEPSEWKEKAQRSGGELSETGQQQEEFWSTFRDRIQETKTPLRARKPRPRHYYTNPIGKTGFHIYFGFDRSSDELYTSLTIDDDEDAFWELQSQADEIERELDAEVRWKEPTETRTGNMRSHIWVVRSGRLDERGEWDAYNDWLLEQGERFHEVFGDRIQRY